jgi:arylsulfatase A-like enzyme
VKKYLIILGVLSLLLAIRAEAAEVHCAKPNILFILADDLGWNDVSYHGGHIKTPHIDELAASGARLEQFYVQPLCTPSRAAFITGRYPIRYGLQADVIRDWSTYGLSLDEKTIATTLKEAGYSTGIIGKWHLGHFKPEYLPTHRGFDYQYGSYCAAINYFTHMRDQGLDWHRNDKALREEGYSTILIAKDAVRFLNEQNSAKPFFLYVPFNAPHFPLLAPQEYLDRYKNINDKDQRTYAAMVACLDDAIGTILQAVKDNHLSENTLIIFCSDNGASNKDSNLPLKDGKFFLSEGGVRVPACAVWPGKINPNTVVNEPVHIVDLYPTFVNLAGGSLNQPLALDGKNIWDTIANGKSSPHQEILLNIEKHQAAIRQGDWKLISIGSTNLNDSSYKLELYNITKDISEKENLIDQQPEKAEELFKKLKDYTKEAAKPLGVFKDNQPPPGFKTPAVWGEQN